MSALNLQLHYLHCHITVTGYHTHTVFNKVKRSTMSSKYLATIYLHTPKHFTYALVKPEVFVCICPPYIFVTIALSVPCIKQILYGKEQIVHTPVSVSVTKEGGHICMKNCLFICVDNPLRRDYDYDPCAYFYASHFTLL